MAVRQRGVPFHPPMPCGAAACHGDLSAGDKISRILLPCALYSCGIERAKYRCYRRRNASQRPFQQILVAVRNEDFRLWLEGSKQVAPRKTAKFTTAETNSSNSMAASNIRFTSCTFRPLCDCETVSLATGMEGTGTPERNAPGVC